MVRQALIKEFAIRVCVKAWQKRCDRRLYLANNPQLHRMTAAKVSGIDVDLNDVSVVWVELPPREIATQ
jgi:hypothetical protein